MTLPDSIALDVETARDDDAPTWSDLDATPRKRSGRRLLPLLREGRVRAQTTPPVARTSRAALDVIRLAARDVDRYADQRPRTRGDCLPGGCNEARPCPWVACKHHLAIDVNPSSGGVKVVRPDVEVWDLTETCALDVADRGGVTLDEIGRELNITRERVRQIETKALRDGERLYPELRVLIGDEPDDASGTYAWDPEGDL